ncbi:transcription-repair coupling factor [Hydrogenimonas urashimensis]|uniref:transcription-repair coupling factor n=1 Tax=Hydrogenimonas urashimensis TaxID=2740515 RepID=UPI0019166D70|nr:transcription-repair coupling factor [Hydrogenimonas urashimensis]
MIEANLYDYFQKRKIPDILLVEDDKEAQSAATVAKLHGITARVLPDFRAAWGEDLRSWQEELFALNDALKRYYAEIGNRKSRTGSGVLLIAPFHTLLYPLPKPELLQTFFVEFGEDIDLKSLKERLYAWGYTFVDVVEAKGEVSMRGDIIDIFSPGSEKPWRISLFDTEVESIRTFEVETQKSDKNEEIERIEIEPALFSLQKAAFEALQKRCEESESDVFVKDVSSLGLWYLEDLAQDLASGRRIVAAKDLSGEVAFAYEHALNALPRERFDVPVVPETTRIKAIEPINVDLLTDNYPDRKLVIVAANEALVRRSPIKEIAKATVVKDEGIVNLLTPDKIIVSLNKPFRKRAVKRPTILLDDLKPGDYVVHENYGVGIFKGIEPHQVLGAVRDFVHIQYQNDDTLLLPVENLDMIDRYIAEGGTLPVLDRLGKGGFGKLKAKVKERLFAIAGEIVSMSAKRMLIKGAVIRTDFPELARFRASAGFEYTPDQVTAVEEIFADLSSGRVMDRLLSGDVGFGKTEVAMNAILAVAKSGYQSVFVVPTTLLSAQHYKSVKARLEPFGVRIDKLDRFTTAKHKRQILEGLEKGELDLVIGTHALLGAKFADLGLVIIDEEHKFGVKQKEALKKMSADVHVLSMSATPIPRSLNMALSKIKGYSELRTPPTERKGVRTFVKSFDETVVKEAVMRELRRGGQIFYVYNSIAGIESKKAEILEILPKLRILILHSKITAAQTEKEMLRFEAGEYDLLLSTSIIESGIHLPKVNTMIVDGADRFGMADLHQLRGRVGRGKVEGYCYFLVENKEALSEQAKRRLIALESNSFLGSGAVLAYHDLEIRGGGNLIGESQSGHIKQIGYALYLKMLEDAIRTLTHEAMPKRQSVEVKLSITAYISDELVPHDRVRLELYRRLSGCSEPHDVIEIESEIEDRFGKPDLPTRQFLDLVTIKVLAAQKGVERISNYNENITIQYNDEKKEYLKARSRDDDDLIATVLESLRKQ